MKHFLNYSVYENAEQFGTGEVLRDNGCDGFELLTSHGPVPAVYRRLSPAVHLPFSTDWLAAWENRPYDMDPVSSKFYMFGRSREEVISTISDAVRFAAEISPLYGVMHLANIDIPCMGKRKCSRSDDFVIKTFAEAMNSAVSVFPGGEPPFRILFENLWWPGLRMTDGRGFRVLEKHLEFSRWGLCLDTGHLMNCLPDIRTEEDGIDALKNVFCGYSEDVIEKIETVHFHFSASADYRNSFEEILPEEGKLGDFLSAMYKHISRIDQHKPFTSPECAGLIDILKPDYLTHEVGGGERDPFSAFRIQRPLFPGCPFS